jgi:hypothetical protein
MPEHQPSDDLDRAPDQREGHERPHEPEPEAGTAPTLHLHSSARGRVLALP